MKKTLFLWLALGATTTAFTQSPDGITGASAVQTGQMKNKGESIIYKGNTLHTTGKMVKTGRKAPDFHLTQSDLQDVKLSDFKGKKVILNVFPSLDTPTCAVSVREFNEKASGLENTVVLCISMDLPFAQSRFCTTEGLTRVIPLSAFRSRVFYPKLRFTDCRRPHERLVGSRRDRGGRKRNRAAHPTGQRDFTGTGL